jgi:hypothetical protein
MSRQTHPHFTALLRFMSIASFAGACATSDAVAPVERTALTAPTLGAQAISAGKPDKFVTDVSRGPLVLFHCAGFDAIATFFGTITTTVFYDEGGTPTSLTNQYHTGSAIYNSVSGKGVFGSSRGPDHITFEPDGSELVASSGLIIDFRSEDGRHLLFSAGRVIQRFNADGTVDTLFTAGQTDDYVDGNRREQICGVLAG